MRTSNIIVAFVTIIRTLMKAGRPVREETPYKIIIHVNGGRRYASTKINYTTEEGKKVSRHKHWGAIDENNRFHPNTTYFNASPAQRKKLIFPSYIGVAPATLSRIRRKRVLEKEPQPRRCILAEMNSIHSDIHPFCRYTCLKRNV